MSWEASAFTLLILMWLILLSFALFVVVFLGHRHLGLAIKVLHHLQFPVMVLGPVMIVLVYHAFGTNLIMPISFMMTPWDWLWRSLPPALILLIASGLSGHILNSTWFHVQEFRGKPFYLATLAYGKNPLRALFPTILSLGYSHSWLQCLPLLFGELLLVEVIFEAPGIGQLAWIAARTRDTGTLLACLGVTSVLYLLLMGLAFWYHRRVGRLLKGYL